MIELMPMKELMLMLNTSKSKECDIFHYWYFLNKGFKFQLYVCNRYYDLLMMSMKFSNNPILRKIIIKIKNKKYRL